MPGTGGGSPFGAPQQGPPPACQQLLSYRDATAKQGQALQAADQKKAEPAEICKLFKAFLGAETKMLKGLEELSSQCGVPADIIKQVKVGDKVRFDADRVNGQITVTKIEKAK